MGNGIRKLIPKTAPHTPCEIPDRNEEGTAKSKTDKANFFIKKFDSKSLNELENMNEKELVEEAKEAKRIVIDQKSL